MLKILKGLKKPKYKNEYVLHIKGYFGDGDEYFTEVYHSNNSAKIEHAYKAYDWFIKNYPENRSDLPKEFQDNIKGASWDYEILPSGIDELEIYYYDEFGNPNDIEVL